MLVGYVRNQHQNAKNGLVSLLLRNSSSTAAKIASKQTLTRLPKKTIRANLKRVLRFMPSMTSTDASPISEEVEGGAKDDARELKAILFDAMNVGDHELSVEIVQQLVENRAVEATGLLPPDILTVSIQLYESAGRYDLAIALYQKQRALDNVNARHLTSILRVLKHALIKVDKEVRQEIKYNKLNPEFRSASAATQSLSNEQAVVPDERLQRALQQALDIYDDAIFTDTFVSSSTKPIEGVHNSVIVANALLAVVRSAPKELLAMNPGILEQCLNVVLELNQQPIDDQSPITSVGTDSTAEMVPLLVQPHVGLYCQLMVIAGKVGLYSVSRQLYDNMVHEAQLIPNEYAVTSLLTAAGLCSEYTSAREIYSEEFDHDNTQSDERPKVSQAAVTKYMEICLQSGDISGGIKAFQDWHHSDKGNLQEPDWYLLSVLSRLCTVHPGSAAVVVDDEEEENNVNNPSYTHDIAYIAEGVRQLQMTGMQVVVEAVLHAMQRKNLSMRVVDDGNYKTVVSSNLMANSRYSDIGSNNDSYVPISLLNGPVGAYMLASGHTENVLLLLQRHIQDVINDNLSSSITLQEMQKRIDHVTTPFWQSIISNLAGWKQWRQLQALTERLFMHHRHNYNINGSNASNYNDCSTPLKAELLGCTAGLAYVAHDIKGTERAEDLLHMYIPVLVEEELARVAAANNSTNTPFRLPSFWHLFHKCASKYENIHSGLNLLNHSKKEEVALNADTQDDVKGTAVGSSGYHWHRSANGRIEPYYICPDAANTSSSILAVVLQEISTVQTSFDPVQLTNNNRTVFAVLHDALSHCYNAKQTLQCIHVFCEFIDEQKRRQRETTAASGYAEDDTKKKGIGYLEIQLPLSSNQESRILAVVRPAIARTTAELDDGALVPEVAALFEMLEKRLLFTKLE
jgi:hypothetical protein